MDGCRKPIWRYSDYLIIICIVYGLSLPFRLSVLLLFARFVPVIGEKSKWMDRVALVVCLITVLVSIRFCLPEPWHAQRMMLDELSFLARERQWDAIIDKYRGKQIYNYVSLNYLNMSLAHKGRIGRPDVYFRSERNEKLMCRLESDLLHGSFI